MRRRNKHSVTIFCISILIIIMTILMIGEARRTPEEVIGKIINIEYEDDGTRTITYEYVVDEKTYKADTKTYFGQNKNVGNEANIRYEAEKPMSIRDKCLMETSIIFVILASLFNVFLGCSQSKTREYHYH